MTAVADILSTSFVRFSQCAKVSDEVVVKPVVCCGYGVKLVGYFLHGPAQEACWTLVWAFQERGRFCVEFMTNLWCWGSSFLFLKQETGPIGHGCLPFSRVC